MIGQFKPGRHLRFGGLVAALLLMASCGATQGDGNGRGADAGAGARANAGNTPSSDDARAIFAGGCFWCVEEAFDAVDGVTATTSGYVGGTVADPSYQQVTAGGTGHAEAVEVRFDPARVSFEELLDVFWRNIDPTDAGGQFCDRGDSYRSELYFVNAEQERLARASKAALQADPQAPSPIVTEITRATRFWRAEGYHQDYHQKNPVRYRFYKTSCGRSARLDEVWDS